MDNSRGTPIYQPDDSVQRYWRVSNAVWKEVMTALPGLQDGSGRWSAVEDTVDLYAEALVKLWDEHDPAQEMKLRMILRDLPKIISRELQVPLEEAQNKTNLFAARVRRGLTDELGAWPKTTIETAGLVRTQATGKLATATMDSQVQHAMLKYLIPSTIAGDLYQDKPRLIEVFDQWLKGFAPFMPELDAVCAASQQEVKEQQIEILRKHLDHPEPEVLEQLHGLYRIMVATKTYADALQADNQTPSDAGVFEISHYRPKIAERALCQVLLEVGQWDAPRAKVGIELFNRSLRVASPDIAAGESPSR